MILIPIDPLNICEKKLFLSIPTNLYPKNFNFIHIFYLNLLHFNAKVKAVFIEFGYPFNS